jgi:hypothetical protein
MAGTRTGFHLGWWCSPDDDGYASFPETKRFVAIFNALPETDLFFRIQLTPVLRIVLFSHTIRAYVRKEQMAQKRVLQFSEHKTLPA